MLFTRNKPAASPPPEPAKVDPPVVDPPVVDPPAAQFVPKEDFDKLQATIYELQSNVTNFFMQQNKGAVDAPPTPVQIDDVSDDDYEKAVMGELDRRTAAQVIQKRATAIAKRENLSLREEVNQLRSVGMGAISNLTSQGLAAKPHYKTYKKEIDAAIAQLPPEARVNAEALDGVYKFIIGGHIDEIMAAERETALRQAAAKPDTAVPGSRSNIPGTVDTNVPRPQDILDPMALAMIRDKFGGISQSHIDQFVKSQRFESWEAYYNKVYKPFESTEGNA